MDKIKLVIELKDIFCNLNKNDRKYSTVWLSSLDDLTGRDRYVLNIKAEHNIDSCYEELEFVYKTLTGRIDNKILDSIIGRVAVFNKNEEEHCSIEDIVIFGEQEVC